MRNIAFLVFCLLATSFAQAHSLSVAHVDIDASRGNEDVRIELDLALRDIALTLPIDANGDGAITWGELQAVREPLQAYTLQRLRLSTEQGACRLQAQDLATRRYDEGAYASLLIAARCPAGTQLQLDYRLLFEGDPRHRALVALHRGEAISTAIASRESPLSRFDVSGGGTFVAFVREGLQHILSGYDHLAFLASLLLPAVLVFRDRRWSGSGAIADSLRQVLALITAFTLAHSLTLSLAALGWVQPASRWVEALIAASVLLAAMHNFRPVLERRLWMAAFGFGLIHGFGFAGALGELGLPRGAELKALFGFNLGVELGQLALATLTLPLLLAFRQRAWYARWFLPAASSGIAGIAAFWLYQRTLGA